MKDKKDEKDLSLKELQIKFPAASNYLVTIFLIDREYGQVHNSKLAKQLSVSKPAVNQAVGRLKKHMLVEQDPYGSIELSQRGRLFAAAILRKHYLIEYVLTKQVHYPWDKADEEAQGLQSYISDEFTDYLYDFFGQPQTCPHGNPFPGCEIEEELIKAPRLDNAPFKEEVTLIRITEEGEAKEGLLRFCHMHNLYPGTTLTISHAQDSNTLEVNLKGKSIPLPLRFAHYLCYK